MMKRLLWWCICLLVIENGQLRIENCPAIENGQLRIENYTATGASVFAAPRSTLRPPHPEFSVVNSQFSIEELPCAYFYENEW